jgi:adenylylsulfate kinase
MARTGKIKNFTGVDEEYEFPSSPEITLDTEDETVDESTNKIIQYLKNNNYLC